jgi:hypothetical protein
MHLYYGIPLPSAERSSARSLIASPSELQKDRLQAAFLFCGFDSHPRRAVLARRPDPLAIDDLRNAGGRRLNVAHEAC